MNNEKETNKIDQKKKKKKKGDEEKGIFARV